MGAHERTKPEKIVCVDLFCGAGGLSFGLSKAGISVTAGVDVDPACRFPFEQNTKAAFIDIDVGKLTAKEVAALYPKGAIRLLAGCAPCQPFSTYTHGSGASSRRRWGLLREFARIVAGVRPELVTMENVPGLSRKRIFETFVRSLRTLGYHVAWEVVDCARYGVPQHRRRLVLLASLFGPIQVPNSRRTRLVTVRDAIASLPALESGDTCPRDKLHTAAQLNALNLSRIRRSRPGGTWREWPSRLVSACHKSKTGRKYPSVYGRMEWNRPSPTITTLCNGFGNGRFGHPQQDRAITLREAALLQSFPRNYRFMEPEHKVSTKTLGRLIGNAVPPLLAAAVGRSLIAHVDSLSGQGTQHSLAGATARPLDARRVDRVAQRRSSGIPR